MGASTWPMFEDDYSIDVLDSSLDDAARGLRVYCRNIVQYTLEHPLEKAPSHFIRELAAFTNQFTTRYLERTSGKSVQEEVGEAEHQGEEEEENKEEEDASSVTTGVQRVEKWVDEVEANPTDFLVDDQPEGNHLSLSENDEPTALDYRIKIRWENCETMPYAKASMREIYCDFRVALTSSQVSEIEDLAAAAVLRRGRNDLDIYVYNIDDRINIISNSSSWLPFLRKGRHARIIQEDRSVIICRVPEFMIPSSATICEVKQYVRKNFEPSEGIDVTYLGWLSEAPKCSVGHMLVTFNDPRAVISLMQHPWLNFMKLRLSILPYRPSCKIVQCTKCLAFGHMVQMCQEKIRCPLCGEGHDRSLCKLRNTKDPNKCINCHGDHIATSDQCPERLRLISKADLALQRYPPFCSEAARLKQPYVDRLGERFYPIPFPPADSDSNQSAKDEKFSAARVGNSSLKRGNATTNDTTDAGSKQPPKPCKRQKHNRS